MAGRKSLTLYEGMTGMMENAFINVKNQSVTITADVEIPAGGANGVILAQGGRFGGWSLYVKDGKPAYTYNFVGLKQYTVDAHRAARAGQGARSSSSSPTTATGAARAERPRSSSTTRRSAQDASSSTNANIFSADEAADVGIDEGTNVSSAYKQHDNRFTGTIEKVQVDTGRGAGADGGRVSSHERHPRADDWLRLAAGDHGSSSRLSLPSSHCKRRRSHRRT